MIFGSIVGDRELVARLNRAPDKAKARIDATVQALGFELERRVKRKLTGEVLNVRTGRLRASISAMSQQRGGDSRSRFVSTPQTSVAYVGTNVVYGAAWEFGSRAHDIVAKHGMLKFEIGGVTFFRKSVHIPAQAPRPFLKPALDEMKPFIIQKLHDALRASVVESLKP